MIDINKKNNIIELIRWYTLQESHRDSVIPGYIKVILQSKKRNDSEEPIIKKVWDIVTKDSFIEQFVNSFDEKFNNEEIKYILDFYKSDVMKKMRTGKDIFLPLYEGFNKVINETIVNMSE